MSETLHLSELKALFVASGDFQTGSVLINDTAILDTSSQNAPYLFLLRADEIGFNFQTGDIDLSRDLYIMIVTAFDMALGWKASEDAFIVVRDAVIATLRNNDLTTGVIQAVRNVGEIDYLRYDGAVDETLPVFITQTLAVTTEEEV